MSGTLPPGDAGTRVTLDLMQQLVNGPRGAKNRLIRETAINVVRSSGAPQHDPLSQLTALFRWVRDAVFFIGDVAGTQTVQSPLYTLHTMAGNCVQRAMLLAALARSIGVKAELKLRAIAANPASTAFSHVYVVATIAGKPLALDPTYSSSLAGFEYPLARRRLDHAL